jgi:hypothetical protein
MADQRHHGIIHPRHYGTLDVRAHRIASIGMYDVRIVLSYLSRRGSMWASGECGPTTVAIVPQISGHIYGFI